MNGSPFFVRTSCKQSVHTFAQWIELNSKVLDFIIEANECHISSISNKYIIIIISNSIIKWNSIRVSSRSLCLFFPLSLKVNSTFDAHIHIHIHCKWCCKFNWITSKNKWNIIVLYTHSSAHTHTHILIVCHGIISESDMISLKINDQIIAYLKFRHVPNCRNESHGTDVNTFSTSFGSIFGRFLSFYFFFSFVGCCLRRRSTSGFKWHSIQTNSEIKTKRNEQTTDRDFNTKSISESFVSLVFALLHKWNEEAFIRIKQQEMANFMIELIVIDWKFFF